VIDGNAHGWLSTPILSRFLDGLAPLALFVVVESHQERPLVDFAVFRSPHFVGTACAMVGYAAGAQVMIFYLPLHLQNAYGFAPIVAGLASCRSPCRCFSFPAGAPGWRGPHGRCYPLVWASAPSPMR
jgi:hypothetical protein